MILSGSQSYQRPAHTGSCCWPFTAILREAEREFISMRTKQGLAAHEPEAKCWEDRRGAIDKERVLDPYCEQIKETSAKSLAFTSRIRVILNLNWEKPAELSFYRYFVRQDFYFLSFGSYTWDKHSVESVNLALTYDRVD